MMGQANDDDRVAAMMGPRSIAHQVIVEGRVIPGLTMLDEGDHVHLIVDGRFGIDVPRRYAPQVAWLVANATAVASGYPWLGAETREAPFAPKCIGLSEIPS